MFHTNVKELYDEDGNKIEDLALSSGTAVNSESIDVNRNAGFLTLLVTEDKAGGAGDVDIYAEYSADGTNWYRAYTTSGGTLTQESDIVTALQNVTRWIIMNARLARYVRIVFDPDADSQITATLLFQEQLI